MEGWGNKKEDEGNRLQKRERNEEDWFSIWTWTDGRRGLVGVNGGK